MTTKFTLIDFTSMPPGGEAIPPEDSEYNRAIHIPTEADDAHPWALFRGEGRAAVIDWVDAQYLVVSGFAPAERLGMNIEAPPIDPGTEKIRVRVSVDFPIHTGVYSWAVASQFPEIVTPEDALHELLRRGDRSVEALFAEAPKSSEGE